MSFFVNVPILPGVPAINSAIGVISQIADLLLGDTVSNLFGDAQQWGIFQGGDPVVTADSVVSMEFKKEWAISDYPVEEGSFETYDRVSLPFDARIRFSAGGSLASREALLSSIEAISGDTDLFDVVTPERVYTGVTISHYSYNRSARNGVGLLQVDVWVFQVNQNAMSVFGNTAAPDGADQVNDGPVQATAPSSSQQSAITNGLPYSP